MRPNSIWETLSRRLGRFQVNHRDVKPAKRTRRLCAWLGRIWGER
jgi:hypothetical protein